MRSKLQEIVDKMIENSADFSNLIDRPGHLIRRLHQIHVALFLEECSEYNLTPVQFGVLTVLANGRARDQVTIAKMIGVDRNTVADVIRRLVRRQLLDRYDNPGDKRTKFTKITKFGKIVRRGWSSSNSRNFQFLLKI